MELLLVLIIAILLLRPQDWQRFATLLGKGIRLWRYYQQQIKSNLLSYDASLNSIISSPESKNLQDPKCKKP